MKVCVVNFSDFKFKKGQNRLSESLIKQGYKGDVILFNQFEQVGSKPHLEVPYQFKVYAIERARQMGYDVVLYCDASLYAIKDIQPCIDYIINNGYLLEKNSGNAGKYSTDLCLNEFNISRDFAFNIQLHSAGFTGLNFKNEIAIEFFNKWLKYAKEEKTFCGDWNNKNKQCSFDDRCLGHRHDQTVASIIAHELKMKRINPTFMQYEFNNCNVLEYASIDDDINVSLSLNKKKSTLFICNGIC
jgi:signal peptidase I